MIEANRQKEIEVKRKAISRKPTNANYDIDWEEQKKKEKEKLNNMSSKKEKEEYFIEKSALKRKGIGNSVDTRPKSSSRLWRGMDKGKSSKVKTYNINDIENEKSTDNEKMFN